MKLHEQRNALQAIIDDVSAQLSELSGHLCSAKFDPPEDWVRTWEVLERVATAQARLGDAAGTTDAVSAHYDRLAEIHDGERGAA